MKARPAATIVEERLDYSGVTWWTLLVGGGATMSASYGSEAEAVADAPLWVTGLVEVISLKALSEEKVA